MSVSVKPKGPLESLMIRNAGDTVSITSFGLRDQESVDSPETQLTREEFLPVIP